MLRSNMQLNRWYFFIALGIIGFFFITGAQSVFADSSCVRCHTNEKELLKNLARETGAKSSATQGAG